MSRLDAIAQAMGVSNDHAREFTRAVRAHFQAAPSYAQILVALKKHPEETPSVEQVVADIQQNQAQSFDEEDKASPGGFRPHGRPFDNRGGPRSPRPTAPRQRERGTHRKTG